MVAFIFMQIAKSVVMLICNSQSSMIELTISMKDQTKRLSVRLEEIIECNRDLGQEKAPTIMLKNQEEREEMKMKKTSTRKIVRTMDLRKKRKKKRMKVVLLKISLKLTLSMMGKKIMRAKIQQQIQKVELSYTHQRKSTILSLKRLMGLKTSVQMTIETSMRPLSMLKVRKMAASNTILMMEGTTFLMASHCPKISTQTSSVIRS
jgi:beta-N-acetylglucosaminidase